MQDIQLLRDSLYHLKFDYGRTIAITKLLTSSVDPYTGEKMQTSERFVIRRAIKLPEMFNRETHQSISAISANKQMVMGGTIDVGTVNYIVDRRDVPSLPDLTADDWIDDSGLKYQIKQVQDLEGHGWIIVARRAAGNTTPPVQNSASNSLSVGGEAEDA